MERKNIIFRNIWRKTKTWRIRKNVNWLKNRKILNLVKGIIVGKPQDEQYYEEYKNVYRKVFADIDTPVLFNVNFGHSTPRCIIPYDVQATIDFDNKKIFINEPILDNNKNN